MAPRSSHQVFLAAWIPDGQNSLMGELVADPGDFHAAWLGKDPITTLRTSSPERRSDEAIAREFLFHDCDGAATAPTSAAPNTSPRS